jgi:6-phosphogluconolactonase (cycloisomerase 2 family)
MALAVGVTVLLVAGLASGAVGDLRFKGCISGELASDEGTCTLIAEAGLDGKDSGLNGAESVTISRDGRWVYAVARQDDSIARFKRDRDNGALTYRGCVTGAAEPSCREIPFSRPQGDNSGLNDVRALVISRDGESAYAVSAEDDAVVRFKRDPANGELRFKDCITGQTESGPGEGACEEIPAAVVGGSDTGLDHPKSLTLSRDGRSLYLASTSDAAIARFKRDPDGKLTYRGCITGETESAGACKTAPVDTLSGFDSGLSDIRGLVVSPDDRWLYGVAADDDAVVRFRRDGRNGKLEFRDCLTGDTDSGPGGSGACREIQGANGGGENNGLDQLRSLALSRDGRFAYVASRGDAATARFRRDRDNGRLTFKDCISGDVDAGPGECALVGMPSMFGNDSGLGSPESVVLSRDGKSLYVSIADDAGVASFKRDRDNGSLTYKGCISGDSGTAATCTQIPFPSSGGDDSGLGSPQFMALSPDDRSLYVAVAGDDAVARFRRER